jgi:signal transduction histidine kinase
MEYRSEVNVLGGLETAPASLPPSEEAGLAVDPGATRPSGEQPKPVSGARLPEFVLRIHAWLSEPPPHLQLAEADVYAVTNYCAAMCLSAHVLFAIVFWALGATVPALVNIGSVLVFALCLFFSKRGQSTTAVLLGTSEVLGHAWMATVYVGWAAGFHFYVLLAIAIVYLFSGIHIVNRGLLTVLQTAAYVALALYSERHEPLVPLPLTTIDGLAVMNIVILSVVLTGMLSYYTYAVRSARCQLRAQNVRLETALVELHQAQDQVIAHQRLAYLGTLTAGIAHEIKNPLNFVNTFAALSEEAVGELREAVERLRTSPDALAELAASIDLLEMNARKIKEHGTRADRVVQSMLLHAGRSSGHREEIDLNGLVSQSLHLARSGAHGDLKMWVETDLDLDPALPKLRVAPRDIARALLNIIGNAVRAAGARARSEGPDFTARVTVRTQGEGEFLTVRVRDNGNGIAPEIRDRIFEPFFTTHSSGEGTGLGLSISHDIIVGQHHGRLYVESEPGRFAEFVIELPLSDRV